MLEPYPVNKDIVSELAPMEWQELALKADECRARAKDYEIAAASLYGHLVPPPPEGYQQAPLANLERLESLSKVIKRTMLIARIAGQSRAVSYMDWRWRTNQTRAAKLGEGIVGSFNKDVRLMVGEASDFLLDYRTAERKGIDSA